MNSDNKTSVTKSCICKSNTGYFQHVREMVKRCIVCGKPKPQENIIDIQSILTQLNTSILEKNIPSMGDDPEETCISEDDNYLLIQLFGRDLSIEFETTVSWDVSYCAGDYDTPPDTSIENVDVEIYELIVQDYDLGEEIVLTDEEYSLLAKWIINHIEHQF